MKKIYSAIIFFLAFSPATQTFGAGVPNGSKTLDACSAAVAQLNSNGPSKSQDDASKSGYCLGYINGVVDYNMVASVVLLGRPEGAFFCPPHNVELEQYARIVVNFLRENPEILHESQALVVTEAFKNAFPCGE